MIDFFSLPPASAAAVAFTLLSALVTPSQCRPGSLGLWSRAAKTPPPMSFAPAQNWEGIDGTWNTFVLRIGSPIQTVRVTISTASQQVWAVDPRGCPDDTASNTTCSESRGTTYNYATSTTWSPIGLYDLWIESNLGLGGNAEYGYDTVGLGYPGEGGPTLEKQTVGALATQEFNYGHFGINPKPTNFTNFTSPSPSFMTTLKDQHLIPSVSWGYTAGVPYRFAKVLSSLTLGGYDSSRFIPNGVSFPFAPDNERDLLVSVTAVNSVDSDGKKASLLPKSVYSYVDSTIAEIWLPVESCLLFEKAFGLKWDEESALYLVSDAQHNALLLQKPNITITVAPYLQAPGKSASVDITLPYAAFDLTAKPPYQGLNKTSRYFPLRRAYNETEYTLGRTFLQEAYLTVDWERQNFGVAQCSWAQGVQKHLVAIPPVNASSADGSGSNAGKMSALGTGAIVGIAIGALGILLSTAVLVVLYLKRQNQQKPRGQIPATLSPKTVDTDDSRDDDAAATTTVVFPKAELDASMPRGADGFNGTYKSGSVSSSQAPLVHESDSTEREIFEMEGDLPKMPEADSNALTEKQAMRYREERINGTDVSPITPAGTDRSPSSTLHTAQSLNSLGERQRRLIRPGEVIELNPVENQTKELVSPLDGSDGRSMGVFPTMTQLSPVDGTNEPGPPSVGNAKAGAERKRFSYEDP